MPIRLNTYLAEVQNNRCKICGWLLTPGHGNVDHDHFNETEKNNVRGLLCTKCNKGLGFLEHRVMSEQESTKRRAPNGALDLYDRTVEILEKAIQYVRDLRRYGTYNGDIVDDPNAAT